MISLYLKPDETQIVRADIRKNMTLSIKAVSFVSSYWQTLMAAMDEEAEGKVSAVSVELSNLFREVRKAVSASNEEFYVVLPDSLFLMVDSIHETVEDIDKYISGASEVPVESFYYSIPIETRPGAELLRTVYAISNKLVQTIVDAAGEEGVTLVSIEPASVSFLRAMGEFSRENFILQTFPDSAQIVAYSPIGGAFRMTADNLSENRLLNMSDDDGNRNIRQTFAELDMVADSTFPSMNDNVPFIVLTEKRSNYMKFDGIRKRSQSGMTFHEVIESEIADDEQMDWMAAVGTLLQDFGEESNLYLKKPSFLTFGSANVLPKGIQTNAKLFRISQKAKQVSRIFILSGLTVLIAEFMAILYFSSAAIPESLQVSYNKAQKEMPSLDAEISVIKSAKNEHRYPVEGITALLKNRPEAVNFSRVSVLEAGRNSKNGTWMEADLVSKEPLSFQDYTASLAADNIFSSAGIVTIGSDTSGYKTATVVLRRREGAADGK